MASVTFRVSDKPEEKVDAEYAAKYASREFDKCVKRTDQDVKGRAHNPNGFVNAIVTSYNQHHHLVLRPDDVWLAIMVQFGMYMKQVAAGLRSKFVTHSDQKELVVYGGGSLMTADYETLCMAMSDQIASNITDNTIRDWVIPAFSTTQHVDKVVGAIALMASLKEYFTYKFKLRCGLPRVTLEGTVDDWLNLEHRAIRLQEFDTDKKYMTKWYAMLGPILKEFTKSAQGHHDVNWWQRCCSNHGGGSGPSYISGWVAAFCVFNDKGEWMGDNMSIERGIIRSNWPIVDIQDIPHGFCTVDVVVDDNGTIYNCELVAGHRSFVALDVTVKPLTSFLLRVKDDSAEDIKKDQYGRRAEDCF